MANAADNIACGGFVFYNNFDSANLAKIELVKPFETSEKDGCQTEGKSCKSSTCDDSAEFEFNLWTKHDCHGTQYQNHNRTWFHFGVKPDTPGVSVKFNIVNLNKQVKMFSQGMCPVFKVVPGHLHWERIREKPTYTIDQKGSDFTLSFVYVTPDNPKAVTYFAFTYPFSYTDLQNYLRRVEARIAKRTITSADDIYYHRECAIKSLEGRRLEVITISSFHNISTEREDRLNNMFPEKNEERPFKFWDKKVIFISARVHPGETPSSFVLNGFLNFLINRDDQIAINLRRLYVFKLIPMLNPDGVAKGHYRMDTRGVNLNRVYLNPSEKDHPTIYAARTLIRYYHHSYKLPVELPNEVSTLNMENSENDISIINPSSTIANAVRDTTTRLLQQVTLMTLDEKCKHQPEIFQECALVTTNLNDIANGGAEKLCDEAHEIDSTIDNKSNDTTYTAIGVGPLPKGVEESGLYLYIDLHGHASKKGVFMYGNYFDDMEDTITCMLLPKLMSINNPNFHFTSCNFTERNMYIIDKRDGMSREGSGRVAVYKLTGLIRSYTLECNYNSGRLVNMIPARIRDVANKTAAHMFVPPKYTPAVFEAVGAALGPSILDLTSNNPNSRLPNSQYRSLRGVKSYLKLAYMNNLTAPSGKTFNKDDNGISSQDSYNSRGTGCEIGEPATRGKSHASKSEASLVKKPCIIRRSTSLYTAVKRMKGNKKPRTTINRRPLKNQCANSIGNSSRVRPEGSAKQFLNSGEHRRSRAPNFNSPPTRKFTAVNKLAKGNLFAEETAVVKQGAKRLKIVSNRIITKAQPEIGEPSGTLAPGIATKPSAKNLFHCNKPKAALNRIRKHCQPAEPGKTKSSKFSEMSRKVAGEGFSRNEAARKILN